jgi:hypothetical protein
MGSDYIVSFNERQQQWYAKRTGILVNIQNIGRNKKLIAVKEVHNKEEIRPGLWLKKEVIAFDDGNFSNMYDLQWDTRQIGIFPKIHSSNKSYSIYDSIKRDTSAVATINGTFFYMTDIADTNPHDLQYDFCIREGAIIGLPSGDEPILITKDSTLLAKEIRAKGIIKIQDSSIRWVGAKSGEYEKRNSRTAVLYNSKCANIIKVREKKSGLQIGILDTENIRTPKDAAVVDIVVCADNEGQLRISEINHEGGTHLYSGLFILQITKSKKTLQYKIGDKVEPISLDTIELQNISSGITLGKRIDNEFFLEEERVHIRDARSIIAKDKEGYIHFIVFDGSKYIPGFNGVSANDIKSMFSKNKYAWAYFLDGGGSSRLIVRQSKRLRIFANQFAFRKMNNGMLLWDWRRARKIASSISLHIVNN